MAGWTTAAAIVGMAGTAYGIYSSERAASAQADAARQAQQDAEKQASLADQAMNQANQKRANTLGALAAAQQAGRGGASGTMLTGPQGVDPSALNLSKNTLLGQ